MEFYGEILQRAPRWKWDLLGAPVLTLPLLSTVPPFLSDGDCLREREEEVEGCLIPSEMLLAEDDDWSPLKEEVSGDLEECKSQVEEKKQAQATCSFVTSIVTP